MSIEKRKGKKGRKEELRMWTGEEKATWAKIGPILALVLNTAPTHIFFTIQMPPSGIRTRVFE